ncbi:phosphoglycerate mutase-like protein [Paxillus ammoniavirescens]|nr:phosphoglycerate mutase-like protein [Paxillus ammoniavirescens]
MYIQGVLNALAIQDGWFSHRPRDPVSSLNLGSLTPYRKGPTVPGTKSYLPDDCTIQQVMLMHRHGSRGPVAAGEMNYIDQLVQTLEAHAEEIKEADLPPKFAFLKTGYNSDLSPEQLTPIGRKQLFDHGVDFALKYPHLTTDTILSSDSERVVESAHWFAGGYFGRDVEHVKFLNVTDLDVPVSWITPVPGPACPNFSFAYGRNVSEAYSKVYIPSITKHLNRQLPFMHFNGNDTLGTLYACAYDLAAHGVSPWCEVFLPRELALFNYHMDVLMDAECAYTVPDNLGPLAGTVYVNKLIERFTNSSGDARPLYLEFGHDITILFAMAALDLTRDVPPLSPEGPPPHRKFRTAEQTPFAANMVWEKFTCTHSFDGPQVRLVLNEETFPLHTCERTKYDRRYGTCSLEAFIAANEYSTKIHFGDPIWNASCGL